MLSEAPNLLAYTLVALVCGGMGLAFFVADARAPTSRALALGFVAIAFSLLGNVVLTLHFALPLYLRRSFVLFDLVAMVALLEWILRVRRTVPSRALQTESGDRLVRNGQIAAGIYAIAAIVAPEKAVQHFLYAFGDSEALASGWFWLFATPVTVVVFSALAGLGLLLNRRPDRPERLRVTAMLLAVPLLAASFALPPTLSPVSLLLGMLIFLVGAVQYHVEQGRRGEFMAQFLSPQVADLVRQRGLGAALEPRRLTVSVVCVDLRGFTAVTDGADSNTILHVLRDYYREVGVIAARYGGTIKDQAGDGVLILVGAPVSEPAHAARALAMAREINDRGVLLSRQWRARGLALGIGIGVASGEVTAGVIGDGARMEYTAVGTPVNLSARLCQQAGDGEVLAAPETVTAAGASAGAWLPVAEALSLKGLADSVMPLRPA